MKTKNVSIKEIYLKDERFRISYYFSLEKIINSFRKIGIVNPPLVCVRNNRFILVSGWKRVLACLELSFSPIQVMVSEEEGDLNNFLYAIYENLATRSFSLIEKAEIIHKLEKFGVEKGAIIKDFLPFLDVPALPSYYDGYLALARFEPELKKVIHQKNITFSSLKLFLKFSSEARRLMLPLLIPLSQNEQKEVLEDLLEIAQRDKAEVEAILMTKEVKDIQRSEKWSSLEKAERIRFLLKKKRYPLLSSWKDSFNSSLRKIQWPKDVALKHPPFFEDENYSVTFNFKSKEEFEARLLKLKEMASKEEFSKIFK